MNAAEPFHRAMTQASSTGGQTAGHRELRLVPDRFVQAIEIVTVIVLSIAALLTSWSSYQSGLWDGDQAARYSQANGKRTTAARAATRAGQAEGVDVFLFSEWLDAVAAKDDRLDAFYRARFRAEFRPAFEAWLERRPLHDPSAPPTPFVMPIYRLAETDRARALEAEADALFQDGQEANRISDAFAQATVILASAMFFGGIGQAFKTRKVRVLLMLVSVATCVWGVAALIGLPPNKLEDREASSQAAAIRAG